MARWRSCWVCFAIRLGGGRRRRLVNKVAAEAELVTGLERRQGGVAFQGEGREAPRSYRSWWH